MRRLGAYPRVSRQGERDDERFRSPDFQIGTMRRWASANGRTLREYPAEVDVSGSRARRPILEEIIQAIEAGELDGILVTRLDRLSRLKPRERLELFERIEDAGGVVLSASENLDVSTPEGRFARDVFLGVARMQWERYAEGFATAKEAAVERGTKISSMAPFGYTFGPEHRLVAVPTEAEIVREMFERRAAGASRGEILEYFEAATGRASYRQSIAYMLRNRAYLGEVHYGRTKRLVNGDAHEAIVPVDLFEAAQRVDRERSSGPGSGGRPRALLAGIARCANCGRGLAWSRTGSTKTHSYKCPEETRKCSARASIGGDVLDRYVTETVMDWAGAVADEPVEVELADRTASRASLERRLGEAERLLLEYEANAELELELGSAAYDAGRRARITLRDRAQERLEEAGEQSQLEVVRTTLREVWPDLDVGERRRLLKVVLEAVVVRRTPRRRAPASERARIIFRGGAFEARAVGEHPSELLDQETA